MKLSQQGQKESSTSAHTVWGASPRRRSWSRTSTWSTTWTNLLTLTFVCVDVDLDRALFNKHSKAWNKDALVGLNRSQHRFLVKINTKVVNEIQVVLTFSLPCTIAAPRRSYCRWSSWSCPQHNPLWLQTQTITMVSMRSNCNLLAHWKWPKLNHTGKYLERNESERDVIWWNFFPLLSKRNNWWRRSTLNIKHKIELKLRKWQRPELF